MTAGYSRRYVLASFVGSQEFKNLCNSYGISTGTIPTTTIDLPFTEKEPNNSLTTADIVNLNSDCKGNLQNSSDVDFYKFTLPMAGKLSIDFKHDLISSGNWRITILDSNNNQLTYF